MIRRFQTMSIRRRVSLAVLVVNIALSLSLLVFALR